MARGSGSGSASDTWGHVGKTLQLLKDSAPTSVKSGVIPLVLKDYCKNRSHAQSALSPEPAPGWGSVSDSCSEAGARGGAGGAESQFHHFPAVHLESVAFLGFSLSLGQE